MKSAGRGRQRRRGGLRRRQLVWADAPGTTRGRSRPPSPKAPSSRCRSADRADGTKGFTVQPRRRVVERTFSWSGRNRHLAKDHENLADTMAAFVNLAAIRVALKRVARAGSTS
ncbi:MAG: transposase [Pseudomonadota bacterium]